MAVANACMMMGAQVAGQSRAPPLFECRADPSGSAKYERPDSGSSPRKGFLNGAAFPGASAPPILRFPPNFVRQLSIKARRNCSNIGVAQVVAASVTNMPVSSAPANAGEPLVLNCNNSVQADGALLEKDIVTPDGTLAVHSGLKFELLHCKYANNMPKSLDPFWEYGELDGGTNPAHLSCKLCGTKMAGGFTRLKYHMARLPGHDVIPCTVSNAEIIQKALEAIVEKDIKIATRERELNPDLR